jgi:hypothetical protein
VDARRVHHPQREPVQQHLRLGFSVEGIQGYLAHKKTPPPQDPTVGRCLGSYGGPRRWAFPYTRGTPVEYRVHDLGFGVQGVGFRIEVPGFGV